MKNKYSVTLILPKDKTILEKKYSEVLVDIVSEILTVNELEYLILKLENVKPRLVTNDNLKLSSELRQEVRLQM